MFTVAINNYYSLLGHPYQHKLCLLLAPFSTRRMQKKPLLYVLCIVLKINYFFIYFLLLGDPTLNCK